ncbi:hypothetical protein FB451DRAFT_1512487 [Mycena latifolia]|nr:hypothetical protein FB451DRAFT_1512487 [Mycena latifolia]
MDIDLSTIPPATPELTRAEGLWFEDCGLIIQAQDTLFRVSRDFLAARSPVFGDMLSLPPPNDAEMMEGCPFVHLPDSAADITAFLKALLYSEFFEPFPAPTSFEIIASVLRMSHKYEIDVLRKRALIHLSSIHPTTLGEWESTYYESWPWFPDSDYKFLDVVLLARQTSASWILPTAFYRICAHVGEDSIINGYSSLELRPVDKLACMAAIRYLETTGAKKILDFLVKPLQTRECSSLNPELCSGSRVKTRFAAENWRDYDLGGPALLPLDLWEVDDWSRLTVCDACLSAMKGAHAAAKEALWDKLPELFNLPNWAELERMKAEALK